MCHLIHCQVRSQKPNLHSACCIKLFCIVFCTYSSDGYPEEGKTEFTKCYFILTGGSHDWLRGQPAEAVCLLSPFCKITRITNVVMVTGAIECMPLSSRQAAILETTITSHVPLCMAELLPTDLTLNQTQSTL